MRKWLLGVLAAATAVSVAACTPTPDKEKAQETTAPAMSMVPESTGGASDKVPDPNVAPVAIISIYHSDDSGNVIQDMDSLDVETLTADKATAQLLVDKLIEYGVLTEGTEVLDFTVTGAEDDGDGTLDLNQAVPGNGSSDEMLLVELGNTFIENFGLSQLKLLVNGADYANGELTFQSDYSE